MHMNLSEELKWRGFLNQTTLSDLTVLDNQPQSFYMGYDAGSSDSLTIGNLAGIMLNKLFIKHGYKAVILAGGATSLIGDPGGKDVERPLQPTEVVEANVAKIKDQLKQLLGENITMVNNLDWYKDMSVLDYLRDVGKHFSMTPLVQRDYIATRMGEGGHGISYTEFSYTLLQGYDFLYLSRNHGVTLQLAGSDQWGNCLSGVELIRRVDSKEVNALTMPLIINQATGKKFGKSEEGAVWLNAQKTAPADFYQFWLSVPDYGVESYLKIYTELDKTKIDEIVATFNNDRAGRHAQRMLAEEVTLFVHGEEGLKVAQQHAEALKDGQSDAVATAQPIDQNASIVDVLVEVGLVSSKTEARQLLGSGGIYINDSQINKSNFSAEDFVDGFVRLRRGKALRNSVSIPRKES